MSLIQLGEVVLNCGQKSSFKLVADEFITNNLAGLVAFVRQLVGPFASVEGVPRGGLLLAEALKPFAGLDGDHLIVDDVLTTGGSMERLRQSCGHPPPLTRGAVVFARGQRPAWIKAVFAMPECFWLQPRHR